MNMLRFSETMSRRCRDPEDCNKNPSDWVKRYQAVIKLNRILLRRFMIEIKIFKIVSRLAKIALRSFKTIFRSKILTSVLPCLSTETLKIERNRLFSPYWRYQLKSWDAPFPLCGQTEARQNSVFAYPTSHIQIYPSRKYDFPERPHRKLIHGKSNGTTEKVNEHDNEVNLVHLKQYRWELTLS